MVVKILEKTEIEQALILASNVFDECLAVHYSTQGIEEFKKIMSYSRLKGLVLRKKIFFWGCFREDVLCGIIVVDHEGQILLFFVEKKFQRVGIGRLLLDEVIRFFCENKKTDALKINVVEEAKEAYIHMGFIEHGDVQCINEVMMAPMELHITLTSECMQTEIVPVEDTKPMEIENSEPLLTKKEVEKEYKKRRFLIYIAVIFILLGVSATVTVGTHLTSTVVDWVKEQKTLPQKQKSETKKGASKEEKIEETCEIIRLKDIKDIDIYEQDDLPYKIEDKSYTYSVDKKKKVPSFQVNYPQLSGLETSQEERINKTIEECAKASADLLMKGMKKETKYTSNVIYKISYINKDFMSIVFEDHYNKGGKNAEYLDLRTLNINLANGMVYALSDIVHLDPAFMNSWIGKLKDEDPSSAFLEDMGREELQKILSGDKMDARYMDEFYVLDGKIEIGITYHHSGPSGITRGWITTPFALDEMEKYKTDSDFWNVIKNDN
ncbi:MAG: GNAT family N-acetyltransferase [Lachnospiraceae bacterium]